MFLTMHNAMLYKRARDDKGNQARGKQVEGGAFRLTGFSDGGRSVKILDPGSASRYRATNA